MSKHIAAISETSCLSTSAQPTDTSERPCKSEPTVRPGRYKMQVGRLASTRGGLHGPLSPAPNVKMAVLRGRTSPGVAAVPELTASVDIKLNAQVSLRCPRAEISFADGPRTSLQYGFRGNPGCRGSGLVLVSVRLC